MLPILLFGLACSSPQTPADTDKNDDTDLIEDTDDPPLNIDTASSEGLTGTIPDEALAAPEFAATNRDGTARGQADLIGHPTVIWFYPLANTPG